VDFFYIFGAAFPPPVTIEVKFCTAKQTLVPVAPAKFDMHRCNESPLQGEKPDFWPVSKFNAKRYVTGCDRLPKRSTPLMPAAYELNRCNCTVQNITKKWKNEK